MRCLALTKPRLKPREIEDFERFAGIVFCSIKWSVCSPGAYWTAVRSTVWATVQASGGGGRFGFGL